MSWRVVVISSASKLDYKMGYLIIRSQETKKVHLGEIHSLIIETTAVSLTVALMSELVKSKIKVVFCDEHRNPISELLPYYGSHNTSLKVKTQMQWSNEAKEKTWALIIKEKILQQSNHLMSVGKFAEADRLLCYREEVEPGDKTNREGHAAKVYFNALFGMEFTRGSDCNINSALNYGYAIILSLFNREIVANGYITQIGIFHDNMYNEFNLASDIMEPFRVLVDRYVKTNDFDTFDSSDKMGLINILNSEVIINQRKETVINAAKLYCRSILNAMDENSYDKIMFYEL